MYMHIIHVQYVHNYVNVKYIHVIENGEYILRVFGLYNVALAVLKIHVSLYMYSDTCIVLDEKIVYVMYGYT